MTGRRWTAAEVQKLHDLVEAGVGAVEMPTLIGRPLHGIYHKAQAEGLPLMSAGAEAARPSGVKFVDDLSAKEVRRFLAYDPETGVFRWRLNRPNGVRRGDVAGGKCGKYLKISLGGHQYLAHRLAWVWMVGEWPEQQIDHHDLDKMNNQWVNLRSADDSQQRWNQGLSRKNRSGVKGVHWCRTCEKWVASIGYRGKRSTIGRFPDKASAACAYAAEARRLFGDYARVGG